MSASDSSNASVSVPQDQHAGLTVTKKSPETPNFYRPALSTKFTTSNTCTAVSNSAVTTLSTGNGESGSPRNQVVPLNGDHRLPKFL